MRASSCLARMTIGVAFAVVAARVVADEPKLALPPGLEMLRRTERAFAKATAEIGVRNGFLMFFAEDAIAPPGTGPARAGLLARPAPVEPPSSPLEWEPLFGDIAQSGELGYLTGPFSFADDNGAKHHGVYFSIWRRNAAGLWQVVLDAGVDVPSAAPEFASGTFRPAPQSAWKSQEAQLDAQKEADALRQLDGEFLASATTGLVSACERFFSEQGRMHRSGIHPLLGRDAILAALRQQPATLAGEVVRVDVAASGDLGWTFGTCTLTAAGTTQKGTYTHVWKRDDRGQWRIVVDVLNPARES